jgi:hypothetical protein
MSVLRQSTGEWSTRKPRRLQDNIETYLPPRQGFDDFAPGPLAQKSGKEDEDMKSFTEREKGFEAEFKHHEELRFRVTARRNRLFGLWAARTLGLTAEEAEVYAKAVIAADFEAPGDGDVIEKVRTDLEEKGTAVNEVELRSELARAAAQAREQIAQS